MLDTTFLTATVFTALLVIAGGLGLFLLGGGLRRVGRGQFLRGTGRGLFGAVLVLAALLLLSLGLNFRLYHRLTQEQPLAEVWFVAVSPQYYSAEIRYPDGKVRIVDLHGDEWQLDARVLKWEGVAAVLGLDPLYKLERISGRYRDIDQEREATRSVHALSDKPAFDMVRVSRDYGDWLPWVDARYGSATYLPMADRAGYTVTLTNTGLIARPLNEPARQAVQRWR